MESSIPTQIEEAVHATRETLMNERKQLEREIVRLQSCVDMISNDMVEKELEFEEVKENLLCFCSLFNLHLYEMLFSRLSIMANMNFIQNKKI